MQWQLPPPLGEKLDNPASLPALELAYIGDAVYELWARTYLCGQGICKVNDLHCKTVALVRAETQAALAQKIASSLTEEENAILHRGRNAKGRMPKHVSVQLYRQATGMEALIGYLYLQGQTERLQEVFACLLALMEEEKNACTVD